MICFSEEPHYSKWTVFTFYNKAGKTSCTLQGNNMSYWIPFRKKEKQDKNPAAMLSLETMFRLHEIADDLTGNLPAVPIRENSIAFFCGSGHGQNVKEMLPLTEENVIRMKKENEPSYSPDPAAFVNKVLYISVLPDSPFEEPEDLPVKDKYSSFFCTVTGKLHPPDFCVSVLASAQGNSFGPYFFKGTPKVQRKCIVLTGKLP